MQWYYVRDKERVGPISESEFQALVREGAITRGTLVWRRGMEEWQRYGDVVGRGEKSAPAADEQVDAAEVHNCVECGSAFPLDEMVSYGDSRVCASCKPVFFQRLKEGVRPTMEFTYGGFWIRFAAKVIDGIIVMLFSFAVTLLIKYVYPVPDPSKHSMEAVRNWGIVVNVLVNLLNIAYYTYFHGKYAATIGKMICGLKIITPDGGRVSYLRAFGRFFAEIVSGMILAIGYIMAGFDKQKRALHDRICSTRVVRK